MATIAQTLTHSPGAPMRMLIILLIVAVAACSGGDDLAGPPSSRVAVIEPITPTSIAAVVGTVIRPSPRVRVLSVEGTPLVGERVAFTAIGGRLRGDAVVRTGSDGIAEAQGWEMETAPGPHLLAVRAGTAEATFVADAHAGPLTTLAAVSDTTLVVGAVNSTVTRRPQVRAMDTYGNPIGGVEVIFTATNGGVVTDTIVVTGLDGTATAGAWTLGPNEGLQSLVARIGTHEVVFRANACGHPCPQLIYVQDGNIHRLDFATGRSHQLTFEGRDRDPAVSGDGKWIAFARAEGLPADWHPSSIYIMAADVVTTVRRRTHAGWFHSPSWSPDGLWLAAAGDSYDCWRACSVYTLGVRGEEPPRRIVRMASDPAWAPDGSWITYVEHGDGAYQQSLHVIGADGTDSRHVLGPYEDATIHAPSWSPDARHILFSACGEWRCHLSTVTSSGSATTHFPNTDGSGESAWSPDGRLIAYTTSHGIALFAAQGGMPLYLGIHGSNIAWQP